MRRLGRIPSTLALTILLAGPVTAQVTTLRPDRVFDGEAVHEGWIVQVEGSTSLFAGPAAAAPSTEGEAVIELPGTTLSPGLIEGHSHVLLHPYNETVWNDQVLKESRALRVARATNHLRNTLMAGFTTIRDLGTEGAGYADVGLRQAVREGIVPGPDMIVAGRAIVATGSYGPKGFHADFEVPLGAEEADGPEGLIRVARDQIGKGADVVKIYADYRWGPHGEAMPSFTVDEIRHVVEAVEATGRMVVAHASTEQGMRNAVMGGVRTIEHGDGATDEVLALMKERRVALFPTLAAVEAISAYAGWHKSSDPEPDRIRAKKEVFRRVLASGVMIGLGSDVGVFTHGRNAWEIELMVEYGMTPLQAMQAATSVNARVLGLSDRGAVREGLRADLIAMKGNPLEDVTAVYDVVFVMQEGRVIRSP